jgi:hypothetical protein
MTDNLAVEQTWRGPFWLPDEADSEQRGVLTYDPDRGVTLSLVGGFAEYRQVESSGANQQIHERRQRFPVIHGRIGSTPVSLLDCRIRRSRSSGWMPDEQEITAARMLKGVFLDDPDAESFSELTLELENLTRWDRREDVMTYTTEDDSVPLGVAWKVTVDPVDPLVASVGDLTIELARRYSRPWGEMRRDGLDASSFVASYLVIKSALPKSIAQWGEVAKQFQDLVTFAMDTPCAVISEALTPSAELRANDPAEARSEIALYSRHINAPEPEESAVEVREAFFTLATDGVDFETVIPRWVEVNNRFRAAFDMILGLRYVKRGYLQNQLITTVAAAESVHASLEFDPPMPNTEFKALKKSLLKVVPDERRPWLREKLGSNRHTLVRQLTDLAQTSDDDVMRSLVPNIEAWATATKNERNPVAHGGNRSADVKLLSAITSVTEAVVIVNLLHQLGLSTERLRFIVVDNPTVRTAALLARRQWPAVQSNCDGNVTGDE